MWGGGAGKIQKEGKEKKEMYLSDAVKLNQTVMITVCLHKRHFVTFKISAN